MTEFELKLEIPEARRRELVAALLAAKASRQRLRARYFDTEEGSLAAQGIVVRMRREGRKWVQTAKAPGSGPLARLEHNAPVPADVAGAMPPVDLVRHAGTPAGEAVRRALQLKAGAAFPPLVPLYETDITRLSRSGQVGESEIEIALDQGRIVAGARSVPVLELEIELKQGRREDAVLLARHWCAAHGLWLSSISKSMKGQRLAGGQPAGPAALSRAPEYPRRAAGHEIVTAVLTTCLEQVVFHASDVAAGSSDAHAVHQLRVGIRRLRTALRELASLTDGIDMAWEEPLTETFRALGRHRDQGHLTRSMEPQMEGAGGPAVAAGALAADIPDPAAVVRAPAFQDSLLGIIGFVHGDPPTSGLRHEAAVKRVRKALSKLHHQLLKDAGRFAALDEAHQHRVRKRLKRLRYLSEFVAPLFRSRKTRAFVAGLKPVQEALGLYNDELMALFAYRSFTRHDAKAWFAVGWLSARRAPNAQSCQQAMKAFAAVRPFWN